MNARGASRNAPTIALGLVLALATTAGADPPPQPVDIKPFKDKLVVLKDAEGGIYAVTNEQRGEARLFYGSGKVLYEALYDGSASRNGTGWSITLQAPRSKYPFMAHLERRKDGSYRRSCGDTIHAELTEVTGDQAKAILDKSMFLTTQVIRRSYLFARDDQGVYYYVDILRDEYGGNGHRVLVGKKGAMKQLPLIDVATDTGGDVFATKAGDLRFDKIFDRETRREKVAAFWVRGDTKRELINLDIYMNQPVIYRELGVYKYKGTLCGNI